MNCTECGAKCVLVETTATERHFECPECCNEFVRPLKSAAPKSSRQAAESGER